MFRDYLKLNVAASLRNGYWQTYWAANSPGENFMETNLVKGSQADPGRHMGLVNCTIDTQ